VSEQKEAVSPTSVFYSYAPADQELRDELEKHLSSLRHKGLITEWHDRKIVAGTNKAEMIDKQLKSASVILLLISPDFMASDYFYSVEMQRALDRHALGDAQVIPILLRPVDWKKAPFANFQCLPYNAEPVTLWSNRDEAFLDIAKGIRTVIERLSSPNMVPSRVSSPKDQQTRDRLLKKVHDFWITGVLEQSLYGATLIALGLHERRDALANPWKLVFQQLDGEAQSLPPGTRITQVYDDAGGELLILGEPGSGKTTLLLELTRELLSRATRDRTYPIPVVFNLSSWVVKQPKHDEKLQETNEPFIDWLVNELRDKYQVSRRLGQLWVESDQILLLLDGLDEVSQKDRAACIDAINNYRVEHPLVSTTVCCRSADYFSQDTRMHLHNAVVIQPLTALQVNAYLSSAGEKLAAVKAALAQDSVLRELASTPLMLSVLILAYHGTSVADISVGGAVKAKRKQIFATYVKRVLQYQGMVNYTPVQTIRWLSWLAKQMSRFSQAQFYIENMNGNWISNLKLRGLYEAIVGRPLEGLKFLLLGALICEPLGVLLSTLLERTMVIQDRALVGGLVGSLIGGPFMGFITGVVPDLWLYRGRFAGLRSGLVVCLLGTTLGGLLGAVIGKLAGAQDPIIIGGVVSMLIGALACVLLTGLTGGLIDTGILPVAAIGWSKGKLREILRQQRVLAFDSNTNRRIHTRYDITPFVIFNVNVWSILTAGSVGVLVGSLIAGVISGLSKGFADGIISGAIIGLLGILFLGLIGGLEVTAPDEKLLVLPNQGIWLSARSSLSSGLIVGPITGLIVGVVMAVIVSPDIGLAQGLVTGALSTLLVTVTVGGLTFIRHVILRIILWLNKSVPKNYPHFLDYAAERILLRKVGGSYIFIHRLLLDYFASLDSSSLEEDKIDLY
jgi:hypothetical protein